MQTRKQYGGMPASVIATICLGLVTILLIGFSVYITMQYIDQKTNVDRRVDKAVVEAKKKQQDEYEKRLQNELAKPYAEFSGPDIMGNINFEYPKTWSVYLDDDGSSGKTLAAYFSPGKVSPIDNDASRYVLRLIIVDEQYNEVVREFDRAIEEGELKSSTIKVNGQSGTVLTGLFDEDHAGTVALFQLREKTIQVWTDVPSQRATFDSIVKTLKFNI